MIQSGRTIRRRAATFAGPSIETDMMVVPAGGHKRCFATVTLGELEAEHAAVKSECPLQVSNLEVHMADTRRRINRSKFSLVLRFHVSEPGKRVIVLENLAS